MRSIGTVTDDEATYELLADRTWRVTFGTEQQPETERSLADYYSGDEWYGPAQGHFGAIVLEDLAQRIGGKASYEVQHDPPDTVS
jgi:hypothetical protein